MGWNLFECEYCYKTIYDDSHIDGSEDWEDNFDNTTNKGYGYTPDIWMNAKQIDCCIYCYKKTDMDEILYDISKLWLEEKK
jgi:hypothetical protein